MGSVSQSAVLPSLLAAPTLATKCVLIWTTTAALRVPTATGGVGEFVEDAALDHSDSLCKLKCTYIYS